MISGKYKLRIIWDLQEGPRRYGEIKKTLGAGLLSTQTIAARVLSRELKALTVMGLIHRKDFKVVPPKVEYSLTPAGESLIPVIRAMHGWGVKHLVKGTMPSGV